MKKISSNKILNPEGSFWTDKVLIWEEDKLVAIDDLSNHDPSSVAIMDGIISPGFINTHCHLELSHMKKRIPTGTGLLPFISAVVKERGFDEEFILSKIAEADKEMWDAGIMAVGDISNKIDSFSTKYMSKIRYYSFIEMFDFFQEDKHEAMASPYLEVFTGIKPNGKDKYNLTPHAPYSVSPALFQLIERTNPKGRKTISIHNQETVAENQLFLDHSGSFYDFFKSFNFSTNYLPHLQKPSIYYAFEHLNPEDQILYIHNTMTTEQDVTDALIFNPKSYWATCPNANLYIENKLPDYKALIKGGAKMTIGTDSLASNWQLSIWEEIRTILKYKSFIPIEDLLTWGTRNGAEALGMDSELGSFVEHTSPGAVLIEPDLEGLITHHSSAVRLI